MPTNEYIEALFNNIAPHYDQMNHLMSFGTDRGWRRKAVHCIADSTEPLCILDVATGTGDFALAIARKVAPGSLIMGTDLSEQMLQVAQQKATNYEGVEFQIDNAEAMKFADGTFDRVSVAFGIRNFEHLEKGLSEMYRVLKPRGRLVILELSYPKNAFLRTCFKIYTMKILPTLGKYVSGNKGAYHYLPQSILAFPTEETIIPMLKNLGFATVQSRRFTFGTCVMYVAEKK